MEVNLSQDLSRELLKYELFNMFNSNRDDRIKVLQKHNDKSIEDILFKYYFHKETGIIPVSEEFKPVFKNKTELAVTFYINEGMNAVVQFIEGKGNTGVLMNLEEHNNFLEKEHVVVDVG